jgi:hypothetical protein
LKPSKVAINLLKEDIYLGNSLGLNATPTININGRKADNIEEGALLSMNWILLLKVNQNNSILLASNHSHTLA